MKYNSCLESDKEIFTHTPHMAHLDDPGITSIPTNPCHFQEQTQYRSKKDDDCLVQPTKLTELQQQFLTWHERLNLFLSEMFQLVKFIIFPKKLIALKESQTLCASFLFGKSHKKGWRTNGDVRYGIRQDDDNNTGAGTSTDKLVSTQEGLVPQTYGILTGGRSWGANVMFDHFSNLISVHLMTSI